MENQYSNKVNTHFVHFRDLAEPLIAVYPEIYDLIGRKGIDGLSSFERVSKILRRNDVLSDWEYFNYILTHPQLDVLINELGDKFTQFECFDSMHEYLLDNDIDTTFFNLINTEFELGEDPYTEYCKENPDKTLNDWVWCILYNEPVVSGGYNVIFDYIGKSTKRRDSFLSWTRGLDGYEGESLYDHWVAKVKSDNIFKKHTDFKYFLTLLKNKDLNIKLHEKS